MRGRGHLADVTHLGAEPGGAGVQLQIMRRCWPENDRGDDGSQGAVEIARVGGGITAAQTPVEVRLDIGAIRRADAVAQVVAQELADATAIDVLP